MILHAQAKHGKRVYHGWCFCTVFPAIATNGKKWARRLPTTRGCMLISRGHGGSATISVDGFDDVTDLLCKTLVSYNILNFWLVGYSLGGRVAMMAACQSWRGFVELLSKAGILGCKMLNNARNVSVPIANGRSVFVQNR